MPSEVRDVAGHGVGVDEQDRLALAGLERGGEVRGDGRLADAALRVEDGDRSWRARSSSPSPPSPPWRIGPLPSSTVSRRMHIASTRQRIESAEYGRVKYSSSDAGLRLRRPAARSARGETTIRAGIVPIGVVQERHLERDGRSKSISPSRIASATSRPDLERLLELARLRRPR